MPGMGIKSSASEVMILGDCRKNVQRNQGV
jgi:hypothetical protein